MPRDAQTDSPKHRPQVGPLETWISRCIAALLATLLIACAGRADAGEAADTPGAASPCDLAARFAAEAIGIPEPILRTITRVETGRQQGGHLTPWPWTLNIAGRGYWLESPQAALDLLQQHLSRGVTSVDIGCFQLNHRWHGNAFNSPDEMLDPRQNALYAAGFLVRLRAELGTWEAAIAAYHSRTPRYAERYLTRYRRVRADLAAQPVRQARDDPRPDRPRGSPRALALAARAPLVSTGPSGARPLFAIGSRTPLSPGQP